MLLAVAVKQISRRPLVDPREPKQRARLTPRPSESAAPRKQSRQEQLDEYLSGAKGWAKISAICERCRAVHVHCVNTGAELSTPSLCAAGGCSWRPAGTGPVDTTRRNSRDP